MTTTFGDLLGRHNIQIPDHLIAQAQVPVLTAPQRQGDLFVRPVPADEGTYPNKDCWQPVGDGVQVVHGEATGNTHWLHGRACRWLRLDQGQVVGLVHVPEGEAAYLVHTDEHGCNGIGPGVYEVRRKREQSDSIQMVAD